jgi:hypothetical protein
MFVLIKNVPHAGWARWYTMLALGTGSLRERGRILNDLNEVLKVLDVNSRFGTALL